MNIAGSLDLSTLSGKQITIDLQSLTLASLPGDIYNFSNTLSYAWRILSTRDGINLGAGQTVTTAFALSTANFSNFLNGGSFSLALANNNRDLMLSFTPNPIPEPDTKCMVVLGFILFFVRPRRHPPSYRLHTQRSHQPRDASADRMRNEMD